MSRKKSKHVRAEPQQARSGAQARSGGVIFLGSDAFESLACAGYQRLSDNPEIAAGVQQIASLIGAMSIHLYEREDGFDKIVEGPLSRIVDITPNRLMDRSNFMQWIVHTMLLEGNGNAVVFPVTQEGRLIELQPIPAAWASFVQDGLWDYKIAINGVLFDPDQVLHFVANPDSRFPWKGKGYRVQLADVANNLKQASATTSGFMSTQYKPSLIVRVDAMSEEFQSAEGRQKIMENYLHTSRAGEPWVVPAEQISVQEVRPLTLSDLALESFVKLDKRTVAAILGVPAYALGVGDFNREEWNNFISSKIMPLAQIIQQQLTSKLVLDPNQFFKFNPRSLYAYDLKDIATIADDQYVRGLMTGNEVRDWLSLSPRDGLNELVILENYIPLSKIGDQAKLKGGDDGN